MKPAAKGPGLHRIFMRGMGRKYAIADSAFKRMQVDAWAFGSILTSIIRALHFGQAGRPNATGGMAVERC